MTIIKNMKVLRISFTLSNFACGEMTGILEMRYNNGKRESCFVRKFASALSFTPVDRTSLLPVEIADQNSKTFVIAYDLVSNYYRALLREPGFVWISEPK